MEGKLERVEEKLKRPILPTSRESLYTPLKAVNGEINDGMSII